LIAVLEPGCINDDVVRVSSSNNIWATTLRCHVILEAFAEYLHAADPTIRATDVLSQWLWQKLTGTPVNNVDRVLHCEMSICVAKTNSRASSGEEALRYEGRSGEQAYSFKGTSDSGRRLLKSLYEYCCSYEQQKWARWVHRLKASDFDGLPPSGPR
jgi:hypothetical protein